MSTLLIEQRLWNMQMADLCQLSACNYKAVWHYDASGWMCVLCAGCTTFSFSNRLDEVNQQEPVWPQQQGGCLTKERKRQLKEMTMFPQKSGQTAVGPLRRLIILITTCGNYSFNGQGHCWQEQRIPNNSGFLMLANMNKGILFAKEPQFSSWLLKMIQYHAEIECQHWQIHLWNIWL